MGGATTALLALVDKLRSLPPEPEYEPQVDDMDEKEERKLREAEDLSRGAVLRGVLQAGDSSKPCPQEGDVLVLHYAVRDASGRCYAATKPEHLPSASGLPWLTTLGKGSRRPPRGWELALYEMHPGEITQLQIKPEYGLAHKNSGLPMPPGLKEDAVQHVELHLVDVWHKDKGCRALGEGDVVYKHLHVESDVWETPRAPYEVTIHLTTRAAPHNGMLGTAPPLLPPTTHQFPIGDPTVPAALQTCVCSMSKGERASFWVPVDVLFAEKEKSEKESSAAGVDVGSGDGLGSGDDTRDVAGGVDGGERGGWGGLLRCIPQGTGAVELEVELHAVVQVRDLRGDGSMIKRRIREGQGSFPMDCPLEDSRVRLHYRVLSPDGVVCYYDTRQAGPPIEFDTGMGTVPDAVDTCSRLMLVNELATVTSNWKHAYEARDDAPPGLPSDSPVVVFEVELLGFDKDPSWMQCEAAEKLRQGVVLKEQGNGLFKEGAWKHAEQKYVKALRVLTAAGHEAESDTQAADISSQKLAVMLNLAAIGSRTQQHGDTITWCNKAIKEDPNAPKAYFRRGVAHGWLGHYEEAASDLTNVVSLDPSLEGDVLKELARMRAREQAGSAKQRAEMTNFFDRGGSKR